MDIFVVAVIVDLRPLLILWLTRKFWYKFNVFELVILVTNREMRSDSQQVTRSLSDYYVTSRILYHLKLRQMTSIHR